MTKNCAWWSDIGETRLPTMQSFMTLLKMLSIKFWLQLVNLVGEMLGRRLVEHYDVIKSKKHFYLSHILEDQYWTHQVIQDKLHQIYTMSPPQKIFYIKLLENCLFQHVLPIF